MGKRMVMLMDRGEYFEDSAAIMQSLLVEDIHLPLSRSTLGFLAADPELSLSSIHE